MRPHPSSCERFFFVVVACLTAEARAEPPTLPSRPPNIVFVMADDLGSAELSCAGQQRFATPNLDRFAHAGLRFTQAYAGAPVCAPSRCSLLTGRDLGHAYIRDNADDSAGNQLPIRDEDFTLAESLHAAGYATACVGKWGLGFVGNSGDPQTQGFDHFFGCLGQVHAHNHYPDYLFDDGKRIELDGKTYAPDLFLERALRFLDSERERPFFLYYATTVPHLALQVPEDSLAEFADRFDETPYDGKKGYRAHPKPRAAYAAMVARLDRDFGTLLAKLDELGIAENTIVVFTSDNGATFDVGGYDPKFFAGNGNLHGSKGTLYEGGIRVPSIVRWTKHIAEDRICERPIAHFDWFPTLAAIAHSAPPTETEGVDLGPVLFDAGALPERVLYFEHAAGGGWQAAREGNWKIVRRFDAKEPTKSKTQLFDLSSDPRESTDLASSEPPTLERMLKCLERRERPVVASFALPIDPK